MRDELHSHAERGGPFTSFPVVNHTPCPACAEPCGQCLPSIEWIDEASGARLESFPTGYLLLEEPTIGTHRIDIVDAYEGRTTDPGCEED